MKAPAENMKISSYRGEYEVRFTRDFAFELERILKPGDVLLLDKRVGEIHIDLIEPIASTYKTIRLEAVEETKSFDGIRSILFELIDSGFKKSNRLVAIGGGIVQDTTAFIASTLYRGVEWVFLPTTLLSQCDSCIGSKSSINLGNYKNQLGGFYPPALIVSDRRFLDSLDSREVESGLGEMAHYFLIDGYGAFERFENSLDDALERGSSLDGLLLESLSIKKRMIEVDEFDKGPRNIFNYGHSFGHAIESYTKFSMPHGIAVAYGMDIANRVSVGFGFMESDECERIGKTLRKIRRSSRLPRIDVSDYMEILRKDKKSVRGGLRLVLTRGIGKMFIQEVEVDNVFENVLSRCLNSFRS